MAAGVEAGCGHGGTGFGDFSRVWRGAVVDFGGKWEGGRMGGAKFYKVPTIVYAECLSSGPRLTPVCRVPFFGHMACTMPSSLFRAHGLHNFSLTFTFFSLLNLFIFISYFIL